MRRLRQYHCKYRLTYGRDQIVLDRDKTMRGAPLLLAVLAAALTLGTGQAAADYRFAYRHWIDAGSTMTTTDAGLQRGCLNDPEPCRAIGRAGVTATPACKTSQRLSSAPRVRVFTQEEG